MGPRSLWAFSEPMLDGHAAAAIRLLILTGTRLGKILTAKWDDIDFGRGIMFRPDSKTGKKPICCLPLRRQC